jgi:hypothetical protein
MEKNKYLAHGLFYLIYIGSTISSHLKGDNERGLAADLFTALVIAVICSFIYNRELKKRDGFMAWLKAFGWPFTLIYFIIYYIYIVPAKFVLRIFRFKKGESFSTSEGSSSSSASKPSVAKVMVDGNIERRQEKINTLKAELKNYEEKYKFQASLPPSARDQSLEVIEAVIKRIQIDIENNENWRDFDIKQQKYRD